MPWPWCLFIVKETLTKTMGKEIPQDPTTVNQAGNNATLGKLRYLTVF